MENTHTLLLTTMAYFLNQCNNPVKLKFEMHWTSNRFYCTCKWSIAKQVRKYSSELDGYQALVHRLVPTPTPLRGLIVDGDEFSSKDEFTESDFVVRCIESKLWWETCQDTDAILPVCQVGSLYVECISRP